MAKTYEAILRSEGHPIEESVSTSQPLRWNFHDLSNTKEMGDLEQSMGFCSKKNDFKVFHFSSSREQEGVSTVVVNLAQFMIRGDSAHNILLIDANQMNPILHVAFNIPSNPGLSDVLNDNCEYNESIYKVNPIGINVMPFGTRLSSLSKGIEQTKFFDLILTLKPQYDYLLIDSSPILASSSSLSSAIASDITYIVIQANKIQWEVAEKAKLLLKQNDCYIGGVILNRVMHFIPQWIYDRL